MKDHYSFIAPYYSPLVKLLFGQKLKLAKTFFISGVGDRKLLIIGGGDGQDFIHISGGLTGEYWEISRSMLKKAMRNLRESELRFRLGKFSSSEKFDEIHLPFVLDTMPDEEILDLANQLKRNLTKEGKILVSDFFDTSSLAQRSVNRIMIRFFRLVTGHRRNDLPDYNRLFGESGYRLTDRKEWHGGWIQSLVFKIEESYC